jgi:hypothetical protein
MKVIRLSDGGGRGRLTCEDTTRKVREIVRQRKAGIPTSKEKTL